MLSDNVYKKAKLEIFEQAVAGLITESQRDELLYMLEEKKNEESLTTDEIEEFFDKLKDSYPDLSDDIDKLNEKIEKSGGKSKKNKDEDNDEDKNEDNSESEVSEAAQDLFDLIELI